MTSNPTSEGLVERLRNWPNGSTRDDYSVDSIRGLLSEAADRIEALEGERDEAAANADRAFKNAAITMEELEASEALVTSLRNQLEGAKEALRGIAHGPTQPARALAASTLYGLEGDQEVRSSNASAEGESS